MNSKNQFGEFIGIDDEELGAKTTEIKPDPIRLQSTMPPFKLNSSPWNPEEAVKKATETKPVQSERILGSQTPRPHSVSSNSGHIVERSKMATSEPSDEIFGLRSPKPNSKAGGSARSFGHAKGIKGIQWKVESWLKNVQLWMKTNYFWRTKVDVWLRKASGLGRSLGSGLLKALRKVRFVRLQPRTLLVLGVTLVGIAGIVGLSVLLTSDTVDNSGSKQTVTELQREVKDNPQEAKSRLLLGHALFSSGKRNSALQSYEKALELDPGIADAKLARNLAESIGTESQSQAANLIVKHKITDAEKDLRKQLSNKRRSVRVLALQTLTKLGKATREDRVDFYLQDLRTKNCKTQRTAVKNLRSLGDKRAIAALQEADRRDKEATPWYQSSCLGDAAEDTINRIRAKL